MIYNMTANDAGKIGFCWKYLRIDPRKAYGCFSGGIYLFVTWDSPVTRDPDEGYGVGGRWREGCGFARPEGEWSGRRKWLLELIPTRKVFGEKGGTG